MGKAKTRAQKAMERNKRMIESGEKPPPERVYRDKNVVPGSFENGKRR